MLNSIFFTSDEMAFHDQVMSDCEKQCSAILAFPNLIEQNNVKGRGLTVSTMLEELKKNLHLFLNIQPKIHLPAIAQLQLVAQIDSMTYCTYLGQTISKHNSHANNLAPEIISKYRGYFLLLAAIIAYNLANGQYQENKYDKAIQLVVAALKWMEDFELNHLEALQNPIISSLRQQLINKLVQIQLDITKAQGSFTVLPRDLQRWVESKNQRAVRYGLPYHGAVIYSEAAFNCYLPDPSALRLLFEKIALMTNSESNQRQQILFFFNIATGHTELLDISFDFASKKLSLINVSSTNMVSQYYLLQSLISYLKEKEHTFEIVACQADVQRDGLSCSLYAYALSGIIAKCSFEQINAVCFRESPPLFFDVSNRRGHHLEPLNELSWCSIHAFGEKAILISQSFTAMREALNKHHTPDKTNALISEFKAKYGLVESNDFAQKRYYIDYLRRRLSLENPAQGLTIELLKRKCNVKDNGQLVRRAVNYCNKTEFEFLIAEFSKLSIDDNPLDEKDANPQKGFTPLMLAICSRKSPTRAIALLNSGKVSPDTKDAHGKSAKDNYNELPSDSAIARNSVLQRFFK